MACARVPLSEREPFRSVPRSVPEVRGAVIDVLASQGFEVTEGPGFIDGRLQGTLRQLSFAVRVWLRPVGGRSTTIWVDGARLGAGSEPSPQAAGAILRGIETRLRAPDEPRWVDDPIPEPQAKPAPAIRPVLWLGANLPTSEPARLRGVAPAGAVGALVPTGEGTGHLLASVGVRWPVAPAAPPSYPVDLLYVVEPGLLTVGLGGSVEIGPDGTAFGGIGRLGLRLRGPFGVHGWGPVLQYRLASSPAGGSLDVGIQARF